MVNTEFGLLLAGLLGRGVGLALLETSRSVRRGVRRPAIGFPGYAGHGIYLDQRRSLSHQKKVQHHHTQLVPRRPTLTINAWPPLNPMLLRSSFTTAATHAQSYCPTASIQIVEGSKGDEIERGFDLCSSVALFPQP